MKGKRKERQKCLMILSYYINIIIVYKQYFPQNIWMHYFIIFFLEIYKQADIQTCEILSWRFESVMHFRDLFLSYECYYSI